MAGDGASAGGIDATASAAGAAALGIEGLGAVARDEDALTLQVPGDGSVREMRALLARLDEAAVEVDGLTVHTPDLDDVFFALTGRKGA